MFLKKGTCKRYQKELMPQANIPGIVYVIVKYLCVGAAIRRLFLLRGG